MDALPVMLNLRGRRCVVVGGGTVGARRARSLLAAGARVTLISPQVDDSVNDAQVDANSLAVVRRAYQAGDLKGALLVVIATSDAATNQAIAAQAHDAGVLVNRADAPSQSDVQMMAHAQHGPITLAVHTQGVSAAAAGAIRRELSDALSPSWPELLTLAAPWRERIQHVINDPAARQARLRALCAISAMALYKSQGRGALEAYYQRLADPSEPLAEPLAEPSSQEQP
jgi:precorrin-2 dehydrogenase/sirohydrochlorin ferrochelatase